MQTYIVKSGDTLYGISKLYGVDVEKIKEVNNLQSNNLTIGQVIIIPTFETTAMYVVKLGDSLYSIARKYNTTTEELIKLNNLKTTVLSVGQQLILPVNGSISDDTLEYTVVKGDSLYSIAKKYNTSVDKIKKLNNLGGDSLSVGQVLLIPGHSYDISDNDDYILYTVKAGDSLYSIAQSYGIDVLQLQELNNLTSTSVSVGQIIKVPKKLESVIPYGAKCMGKGYTEPKYITYTVKKGDSLYTISKLYNVSIDSLIKLNNLETNSLDIGQVLKIKEASNEGN